MYTCKYQLLDKNVWYQFLDKDKIIWNHTKRQEILNFMILVGFSPWPTELKS